MKQDICYDINLLILNYYEYFKQDTPLQNQPLSLLHQSI